MTKLEGQLELSGVVAISVSSMIGSGIFVLPGIASSYAGASIGWAYLVAGLCVLPPALSKAELATVMPASGGTYVYLNRTFGPFIGTISGLGLWLSLLLKSSFALIGLGVYLEVVFDVPVRAFAIVLVGAIVALNIVGVRGVSRAQKLLTSVSLVALLGLATAGLVERGAQVVTAPPPSPSGFLYAVAFVFVSYAGVTQVAAIAEEVKRPERNIPLGILLSLGLVMLLYVAVSYTLVRMVSLDVLAASVRPIYDLAAAVGGPTVGVVIAVVAVVTLASMANAGLLSASRFPFAMSRDSLAPSFLMTMHARWLTPINAILVSGALVAGSILVLDVEGIAKAASTFMIMAYVGECLAVIVLREANVRWYQPTFRSPLYPWMQIAGTLAGVVLLVVLGFFAVAAGLALAVPGALIYVFYGRHRTSHQGVVGLRGPRRDLLKPATEAPAARSTVDQARAKVVCALFGHEGSPEMLIELGAALAGGAPLEVLHVTEVPEQTVLQAIGEEEPMVASIQRRSYAMAETRGFPLEFSTLASHDVARSIAEASGRRHCEWLVIEHGGRRGEGITFRRPLGWLKDHVRANLAIFRDAGVRTIRKILVYPSRGSNDALVVVTADQLAEVHSATLTFVACVSPDAGSDAQLEQYHYLDQLARLSVTDCEILILETKKVAEEIARLTASYDLLVTADSPSRSPLSFLQGTMSERITEWAACSVLRVLSARHRTHEAFDRRMPPSGENGLAALLDPQCIEVQLPPMKKEALFNHFARVFSSEVEGLDAKQIQSFLWEREREQNTAVGGGLAMPHATVPGLTATHLGVFVTAEAVAYGAPDGEGVDVFFVTLGGTKDLHAHLAVLSSIAKLVRDPELVAALRSASSAAHVVRALSPPRDLSLSGEG